MDMVPSSHPTTTAAARPPCRDETQDVAATQPLPTTQSAAPDPRTHTAKATAALTFVEMEGWNPSGDADDTRELCVEVVSICCKLIL